jgi:hypothetical protein
MKGPFSFGSSPDRAHHLDRQEYVLVQRPLTRILSFTGRTIDDVVNSPIAKNQVFGFFKLGKQIERQSEIRELERQWNGVA